MLVYIFDKKVLDFIKLNEYLDMPDLINDLIKKKSISFYINDKEWKLMLEIIIILVRQDLGFSLCLI